MDDFRHWALDLQLQYLEENLSPEKLPELIQLCSDLADTKPLVSLVGQAQSRGIELDSSLGEVLLNLSTSALQKLLESPGLGTPVKSAWTKASVDRLVSFALLDRYLRRRHPRTWKQCLAKIAELAEQKMAKGAPPDERLIFRLEGREQKRLQKRYPETREMWYQAWADCAKKAIHHLAQRPRGVSLANAERLLSQQVYTDQGHFILELLQNADDAGATEFKVHFAPDSVTVIHNGDPFDFRDLVGVLSIGQTTKTERQIGYFGVGFKSVFEVTDRPRIYSGHFAFEIVEISVPRNLLPEPGGKGRTKVVLPLKEGRSVEPYFERALEIEPTLLLNLPNVRTLRWTGPNGKEVVLTRSHLDQTYSLCRDQESEDYLVWRGEYKHTGRRPEGKPQSAELMLAFPQKQSDGVLQQNLFSFLPIQESSGLRFLVGSHFDVPVDRERLDQTSSWNRGILGAIPDIICRECRQQPEIVLQLLEKLPLPSDPVSPLFRNIGTALVSGLRELEFVPHLEGWRKPSESQVLDPDLASLFSLDERENFLEPEQPRTKEWLEQLGAGTYDLKALIQDIASGRVPSSLKDFDSDAWVHFHKLLLQNPSFEIWEGQLRRVRLFPSSNKTIESAESIFQVPLEWADLFKLSPPTLWKALRSVPETEALVASLQVRLLGWEDVLNHLDTHKLQAFDFEVLIAELCKAPKSIQLQFLRRPIFENLVGQMQSLAPAGADLDGALIPVEDLPAELFPDLSFCKASSHLEPLLQSFDWPRFGRSEAIKYLLEHGWEPTQAQSDLLAKFLLIGQPELATLEDSERLAQLPIFESGDGSLTTLRALWTYADEELVQLLPDLPRLQPGSRSERLVEHFGLEHLLGKADLSILIERFNAEDADRVLSVLAEKANSLSREQISRILRQPLIDGRPVYHCDLPDLENAIEIAEPDFVSVLSQLGLDIATIDHSLKLAPLMTAAGYQMAGHKRLVETLQKQKPPVELLESLHELFIAKEFEFSFGYSESILRSLPIWQCTDGEVRATVEIVPNSELAQLLELSGHQLVSQRPELENLFPLLEPLEFLVETLKGSIRPGATLAEQPAWFDTVAKVDAISEHLTQHVLCVDSESRVRDKKLLFAPEPSHVWLSREFADQLLHPDSSAEQIRRAQALEHSVILQHCLSRLETSDMRQSFYQYLGENLGQIAGQARARAILLNQPIWLSAEGEWRHLDELVLEPGLPDLGYDWYPNPEIPETLLEQLRTTLEVGRPEPETLFASLLPAYRERLMSGQSVDEMLLLMSRIAEPLGGRELRDMVAKVYPEGEFLLPIERASYPISECYAPPQGLPSLGGIEPVGTQHVVLARKLGLPHLPSVRRLTESGELSLADARRLQVLVEWVWKERTDELEPLFEFLGSWPWMPNQASQLKAPRQLYMKSLEVEELIGASPELFPATKLPETLWKRLGLKTEDEVELPQALAFLSRQIKSGQRIGSRFYYFLDELLANQSVAPAFLRSALEHQDWIWTDEAEFRNHSEVIGFPAYKYFGRYRGTWELACDRFPHLTRFFEIPSALYPVVVERFLRDVAQGQHVDCPIRLLENCLAHLGRSGSTIPRNWNVLPARLFPTLEQVLVAAEKMGVVRSNSPTLAALFGQGGNVWVVETDHPEHGEDLESLYQSLGIPKLREAYTVHPDDSGKDVTAQVGEEVSRFRSLLNAVDGVLPRLKAARSDWAEGEWLAESQLRPFTTSASIRVIEGLQLIYELQNISRVKVHAAIAYDPDKRRLLVSSEAIREPQQYAVELAEGLVDCIYQGPGSENLVDLLNLLLLYGSQEQMHSYLNQRHFPGRFDETTVQSEPWRRRLGEILDFGLHHALERYYPELQGAKWEKWRDPTWTPESLVAGSFLAKIGIHNPSEDLQDALTEMMESTQLRMPSQEGQVPVVTVREPSPNGELETQSEQSVSQSSRFGSFGKALFQKFSNMLTGFERVEQGISLKTDASDLGDTYRHPPERHILFSDTDLKGHSRYCLHTLCSNFDPKAQKYRPAWNDWKPIFIPTGRTVQFSGSLTMARLALPMPLYSRFTVEPRLAEGCRLEGPDDFHQFRIDPPSPELVLSYDVDISGPPDYKNGTALKEFDSRLVSTTVMTSELPSDLRQWIDWAKSSGSPHWQLADRATEMIRASYKYDLNYLSTEPALEVLRSPLRSGENRFLSLLHAGAGGQHLGTGVCTELSAILLELLRHCGVPCVIAGVWMLDQGLIHMPDHTVVFALVPSDKGPYLLPLDPSRSRLDQLQQAMDRPRTRLELLEQAAGLLLPGLTGLPESGDRRQRLLQDRLLGVFGHSELLELFLSCLARPGRIRKELTPELSELAQRGFLNIVDQQMFQVWIAGLERPEAR